MKLSEKEAVKSSVQHAAPAGPIPGSSEMRTDTGLVLLNEPEF